MTGYEWLVPLALGTLIAGGLIVLGVLANYGFKSLTDGQKEQSRDIKEIKLAVTSCVQWDDLDKELGPIRADVKSQGNALIRLQTQCEGRSRKD